MLAATGLRYDTAFEMLATWEPDVNRRGRCMALAMANGFYGCRMYCVMYNEDAGTFALVRP